MNLGNNMVMCLLHMLLELLEEIFYCEKIDESWIRCGLE